MKGRLVLKERRRRTRDTYHSCFFYNPPFQVLVSLLIDPNNSNVYTTPKSMFVAHYYITLPHLMHAVRRARAHHQRRVFGPHPLTKKKTKNIFKTENNLKTYKVVLNEVISELNLVAFNNLT